MSGKVRKLISVLLAAAISLPVFTGLTVLADNIDETAVESYSEDIVRPTRPPEPSNADGMVSLMSKDDTYSEVVHIKTVEDLLAVEGHRDGYYILENDLNISGMEWKALNLSHGVFNGNGHTISGMTITEAPTGYRGNEIGFFGGTDNYVYDLKLDNIKIILNITDTKASNSISAMGSAYADSCRVSGKISVDLNFDGERGNSGRTCAIERGTDCRAEIDIKVTTRYREYNQMSVYGLYSCTNSVMSGDIYVSAGDTPNKGVYAYGLYDCANSKMYGDMYIRAYPAHSRADVRS